MDRRAYRVVDLTHVIEPETGERPVHIERVPAPHAEPDGPWYIMHRVEMTLNHVGTHIETPYHVRQEGMDIAQIPAANLCGPGILLDLTFTKPGGIVTRADMEKAAKEAGGIREGDILLARFDYDGTAATGRRFEAEAIAFVVDAGIKMMAVDLAGIELPEDDPRLAGQYNHHQLLDNDICLIERAANLNQLSQSRFFVFGMPVPIKRLDSFPVRLIALEDAQ
ncbi:MAG: cyclase family protein [Chloroflexota bacterium]|nr:cyclase family protein [Chloroflexota bacterium]